MLDVRDRLARIEVKIDNTNDALKAHDVRITQNRTDIDELQTKQAAAEARVSLLTKLAVALPPLAAGAAWIVDKLPTAF